jgi:regulator of nucleoside diphosphate kinase
MRMQAEAAHTSTQSRIALSRQDYEQLSALARAASNQLPDMAARLSDELDRADVVPAGERPVEHVGMGSEVEYRDEATQRTHRVILVYPDKADISQSRISVLTPIGTALVGLRVGDSIEWEMRTGEVRSLTVLAVRMP